MFPASATTVKSVMEDGLLLISRDRQTDPSLRQMDPQQSLGTFSRRSSLHFERYPSGSALYVKTSEVSNATANLTVSSLPSGRLESRVFSPSRNFWAFEGLDESQLTTVAVTYLPEDGEVSSETPTTRLDIDFFKISVSNASVTTSFLPSQTLPTSSFTPSFAPATTLFSPTATPSSSSRLPIGAIVGGTIGGFVGVLLFVSLLVFVFWRRLRRQDVEQQRKEMSALQAAQQILPVASRRTQLPPLRI
ncbi:hypothetical protein A7U60_g6651 [Sanghuangporus baumii]|uniref:Transmembrane protein n=1 Tax=Sanghuangporus baumii TaxID=108892 RepID=A0A9Q5HUN9_SANBA|nr:hypothetical protein A7U60_g6651 [Sanghuangporus baumii]